MYDLEELNKIINKVIIACVVILLIMPVKLIELSHYNITAGYVGLGIIIFILPYIFLSVKSYWENKVTIVVWGLRIVATLIFLMAGFKSGMTRVDILSFGGTIAITFFYEFGYFIVKSEQLKFFFKMWIWCTTVVCIYLLYVLLPFVIKLRLPSAYMIYIRDNVHYSWPNHISIVLLLSILMVVYLSKKNKGYLMMLMVIFPVMILAYSRAAFGIFGIVMILLTMHNRMFKFSTILKAIIVAIIMVQLFIFINRVKEARSPEVRGAKLIHSTKMRISRWNSVLLQSVKDNPFTGIGFRSAGKNIPTFITYQGDVLKLYSIHNDYVDSLVRGGIFYFVIFWSFIYFLMFKGLKTRNTHKEILKYLSFSILIVLLAGFTQGTLKDTMTASIFWIYIAAIGFYIKEHVEQDDRKFTTGTRIPSIKAKRKFI